MTHRDRPTSDATTSSGIPQRVIDRRTALRGAAAAGLASVVGVAGCMGDGASSENTLEIVHWWTAGGEEDALQAVLNGFQEEYPNVEIQNNPAPGGAGSALDAKIKNRVLNENPPSTFQIWPGQSLTPYTDEDLLDDIGGEVWSQDMRDAYLEGPRKAARIDGSFYAVPINIHRLNNLFYNVSVVEAAGVDPGTLETPGDVVSALETVESETDAAGMAQQTQSPWSTVQLWETVFIGEQGVEAFDDLLSGNAEANRAGIRSALEQVVAYRESFNEDSGSIAWDQANGTVINGEAAFIHQGDWAAGQYRGTDGFTYGEDWDYVPFPGTEGVYALVMDSFVFPTNNPSPETTRQFLSYCGTVDAQERFNPVKGSIPPRTDVPSDAFGPFLSDQIEHFSNSDSQPPTIAHGTGVRPDVKSAIEQATASFLEQWDAQETTEDIVNAFGG
jgi:glucose/mannose transport system substrate-binding protein